jgi:hypothetical protein
MTRRFNAGCFGIFDLAELSLHRLVLATTDCYSGTAMRLVRLFADYTLGTAIVLIHVVLAARRTATAESVTR